MTIRRGIAFLCTTKALGGIELNILRLVSWLRQRGRNCTIYGVRGSPLIERAVEAGIPVYTLTQPHRYGEFCLAKKLANVVTERNEQVLVMNAPRDLNLGVLIKRFSKNTLRLIQLQHMQFGGDKRDFFHSWEHRHIDAWISPLPWLARQVKEKTTISDDRIYVVPFGIDTERFEHKPDRYSARLRLQLPDTGVVCGIIGRFDYGKAQEYLLHAAALLSTQACKIHILLVGEDTRGEEQDYGMYLRQLADKLDISKYVHFRPFTDDVEHVYASMDIFVLTSLAETFGMVTIEAMASGLPVIATAAGGTPDIIEHDKTGLLVPARDPIALASAILRLLNNPQEMTTLGYRARDVAIQLFSHYSYCEKIETIIDKL